MIENYIKLGHGHVYQKTLTDSLQEYNTDYSSVYNTYHLTDHLSKLRYNTILESVGPFQSVCDFGYGNGSFLNYCHSQHKTCYGYDISGYPLQDGIMQITDSELDTLNYDVITFFDSLEHLPIQNLTHFLKTKHAKHYCISVPWFHESLDSVWFSNWKHRRENEHLHHFDSSGLIKLLVDVGCSIKYIGNFEDKIRTPCDVYPNILTVIATKIN